MTGKLERRRETHPRRERSMRKSHENAIIQRSQRRHRSLSTLISLSFAATLGGTTIGCSGEGVSGEDASEEAQSNDAAENALIEYHLGGRGYDTSTLQFQGDTIIVEGDIEMSRAELLDDAEAEATGVVEKGYSTGTRVFAGQRIQLSFAAGVSNAWRTALNAARNEWNSKTPKFAEATGGAATISVVLATDLPADTVATGTAPPNRTIKLNSNYSGRCASSPRSLESIPANRKVYTAMHEIGHVLGFEHPPPFSGTALRAHIAGTAQSNGTTNVGYATVMIAGTQALPCPDRITLTPDDVLSAQKKYPGCVQACEQSCFNIGFDPSQIGPCVAACPSLCGG